MATQGETGSPGTPARRTTKTTAATKKSAPEQSPPSAAYDARPWLAAYPAGVPADPEIPEVALTRLLDDAAASFPSHRALTFLGVVTTYRELRAQVNKMAGALSALGVSKGDRVALVLPNCPQFVITLYATLRLGAIAVPLNPLATEEELVRQFADATPTVVVCLDKTFTTVDAARARTDVSHVVVTSAIDYVSALTRTWLHVPLARNRRRRAEISQALPPAARASSFAEIIRTATPVGQAQVSAADTAVLMYTGGTTGVARAAKLSHGNLVANAYQARLWYCDAQAGREVTLAALPLSHAYGLTLCLNTTLLLAGTLVLLPRWNLDDALSAIDDFHPTLFPGVPPIYEALVASPKTRHHDLRSIRACVSGAMRLPPETQEQFEKVTGGRLVEGYGMTETSPVTHANPLDGSRKRGTIGVPLAATRCVLVDPEDPSRVVVPGERGELAIAGPQVFAGYWGAESDGTFTPDGYYLTGDIAVMDDDGFFTIVDRKKELIIVGGFNIYPLEVEEVLCTHPQVVEACVIGVPDRYRGETVRAYVVVADGADVGAVELVEHCQRTLTAYKVPKQVEFRDELPRTSLGKIQRHLLRAEAVGSDSPGVQS